MFIPIVLNGPDEWVEPPSLCAEDLKNYLFLKMSFLIKNFINFLSANVRLSSGTVIAHTVSSKVI